MLFGLEALRDREREIRRDAFVGVMSHELRG